MEVNKNYQNDEITLQDLIVKIKAYINEVLKYWKVVALFCLLTTAIYVYLHYKHVPSYTAELRFVVEGQSSGNGGLNSLLGTFGIKKGGKVNPYKILEVGKSSDIFVKILSEKINPETNIANQIITSYNLNEKWQKSNSEYADFKFCNCDIEISGSDLERGAIKKLKTFVWGSEGGSVIPLTTIRLNEDTGIYTIKTNSIDEDLSIVITTKLYEKIKHFFEEEVFLNQKQLADILSAKADSLKLLNESKIRELARFEDRNRATIYSEATATKRILSQENMALSAAYAEVMKSKEMTDVNLKDIQPLFMAIDTPFSPISPLLSSLLLSIIKGFILGGIIATILLTIRKMYKDIMSN